jgi:hypothetical protein
MWIFAGLYFVGAFLTSFLTPSQEKGGTGAGFANSQKAVS